MSNIPTETVLEGLTTAERRPIEEPNINDVQRVRSRLANYLVDKSSDYPTGHIPNRHAPWPPTSGNADLIIWQLNKAQYEKWYAWDKVVLAAIKVILPNGLTDLELTHTGALPITLTARMAFDHIEGKAKTDKIATDPYCGCVDTMLGMAYLPNGNGPLKFFKAIVTAQFEANALDDEGTISDGQLIIFSKRAFSQCGHEAIYIASASTKWNEEDNKY